MSGYDAMITWDAVTQYTHGLPMTQGYYFIYFNGSDIPEGLFYFLNLAYNTTYIHTNLGLGAEHMFYRVKAIKLYRQGQSNAERETWLSTALIQGMSEAEVMQVLQNY